jgi:hypothetical protein
LPFRRRRFALSSTGGGQLDLPLVAWDGGPDYYTVAQNGSRMTKAEASGWSDPSFIPISVWNANKDHAAHYASLGINVYMMVNHTPPISDVTNVPGMSVIIFREVTFPSGYSENEWTAAEIGSDPGVVAYFIYDEAEQGEGLFWNVDVGPSGVTGTPSTDARRLEWFEQMCSDRLALNDGRFLFNNFAKGVLNAGHSGSSVVGDMIQAVDATAVDLYVYSAGSVRDSIESTSSPVPTWPSGVDSRVAATYGWTIDQQKSFQSPVASQPAWVLIETKKPFLGETTADIPLYAEIEGAVWSSIIHEARGIVYFSHNGFYPPNVPAIDPNTGVAPDQDAWSLVDCELGVQTAVAAINSDVLDLATVINTQSYVFDFAAGCDTMLKAPGDGFAYIFAQPGLGDSTGSKTFTLTGSGITGTTVTKLHGGGSTSVSGGTFSHSFPNEYSHEVFKVAI